VRVAGSVGLRDAAKLMGEERDSFWQLEHANRRKTVELVAIFILVYVFVGGVLDLIFHTVRIVNHQLTGLPVLTIAAAVIAVAQALRAYYRGSSVLIGVVGADDLTSDSAKSQMAADVVDEIALAARVPPPRLCVMEDPAPNAFATGRDPAHSTICVTRGLLDQFDREELQGVIAHEIAHIRGHDTRVSQMAAVMVGGFALISGSILRSASAQRRGETAEIPGFGFVALPVLIIGGIGWLFSKLAAIALSREREYLADALAIEFTRNPAGLIRALEHIARVESPLKASLRGVAPLFIVDPFECGGASWAEYLDEVARIESQQDKSKEQRDAEVAQYVAKGMPQSLFQGVLSSHPPIHDRIIRLRRLMHQASGAPPESETEIQAQRKAAAKTVREVTTANPEAMAAAVGAMMGSNTAQQMIRAMSESAPPGESERLAPPEQHEAYDDPSQQATYQKLYEYNLGLTGDRSRLAAERSLSSESPLDALLHGQSENINPAQLRAALELGIASAHRKPPATSANTTGSAALPRAVRFMFWIVIALCAGAIAAAFALR
jgi:heat shock protein HtpX